MARGQKCIDALIVGAGFGGIYQLYELTKRYPTWRIKLIDIASDVGGTWFWNRYPGALSDTEAYLYRYLWDDEDLQTYPWSRTYVTQPEALEYLSHVVSKHDLRQYMQLETEMTSAEWDSSGQWRVTTAEGEVFCARYVVTALGLLSKTNLPDIPWIEAFKGDICHTAAWPDTLQLRGKRVGIIGCGSTGVQVITAIAKDVGQLYCFQRTPQYTVPSGDKDISPELRRQINESYGKIIEDVKNSAFGFGFEEGTEQAAAMSEDERNVAFEALWQQGGGLRFLLSRFADLATNRQANEAACEFIRRKIRTIVKDPEKARKLCPTELYARRPLCDAGYYEQFNRENVDIISLKETPIEQMTQTSIRTTDGKDYEIDVLILATGFDAVDGNYLRLPIVGVDGLTIQEHWKQGPTTYLGCAVHGFPNLYMITGPQGPFSNIPPAIEAHVEFITETVARSEEERAKGGLGVAEVSLEAEMAWNVECERAAEGSLFKETGSWIFGRNVPGKAVATRFYFGGLNKFRAEAANCVASVWEKFVIK